MSLYTYIRDAAIADAKRGVCIGSLDRAAAEWLAADAEYAANPDSEQAAERAGEAAAALIDETRAAEARLWRAILIPSSDEIDAHETDGDDLTDDENY